MVDIEDMYIEKKKMGGEIGTFDGYYKSEISIVLGKNSSFLI